MSKYEVATVKCPHCGNPVEFKMWRSINTAHNPEMKEAVREGAVFDVHCDKCNEKSRISYPCLYNQMEDGILLYLVPQENVSEVEEMFKSQGFDSSGIRPAYRIVTSYNQLREKLMIFDDQRDDRAVELAKVAYKPQLESHHIDQLLYSGRNQGVEPVLIAFKDGKPFAHCPISDQLYAEMAEMTAAMENLSQDYIIDGHWADSHFTGNKPANGKVETMDSHYPCGGCHKDKYNHNH